MESTFEPTVSSGQARRWQPLSAIDRRVLGVLAEKAKTTPDVYPMSVNAIRSGCNQKNNRFPLMELEEDQIADSLERLKAVGAAAEIQGGGRVARYKHYLYEWLGVEKVELSVMTELLLRGAQTEGELRGRAARMDPIPDVTALRTVLQSLSAKGLIVSLSPEGRGHVLTHALYEPREMEKLHREHQAMPTAGAAIDDESTESPVVAHRRPAASMPPASEELSELRREVEGLRGEVQELRRQIDELWSNVR